MAGPIPVSTLVAVLIICIGIGLFAGTGYVGCKLVSDAFEKTDPAYTAPTKSPVTDGDENMPTSEPETLLERVEKVVQPVQISIFCLSGLMVFEIIYFLFQAFMATAAINRTEYSKQNMICGNVCWTAVSVVCSYVLTLLWALVSVGAFYCFLITFMLHSNPTPETIDWRTYGLKGGVVTFEPGEVETFRKMILDAYVMFAIFTGASLLVLVGMINLTMCHSANLAHLKTSSYWQKYNERKNEDQMELSSYTNHGAVQSTNGLNLTSYS